MAINKVIKDMSLKELISLCSGKDEWYTKDFPEHGIPSALMSDGPNGVRKLIGSGDILGLAPSEKATCFPSESMVACSFDRELLKEMASALAEEAGDAGVSLLLGPGINMKRNPLCGRNFEYFSEDPYLAGKLAIAYITAMQEKGIGSCLKHFACNSQEYFRMVSDSIMDERTLREIYLSAFEDVIKQGKPDSVMCAYNKLNGIQCSDNKYLLTDILREEWGYDGFVVTDWGAINDRSKAFEAGCDLVMPGGNAYGEKDALENVEKGILKEEHIYKSAKRILRFVMKADHALTNKKYTVDYQNHHDIARRIAERSAVLLKNNDDLLPCERNEIVLIGHMAEKFRYQGYGSSHVNPTMNDSLLDLLPEVSYSPGYDEEGNTSDTMLAKAIELAKTAKKVVIVAGLPDVYEAEGLDRSHMKIPKGQNRVIAELAKANPNIIVVLCCGCAVETPWADDVKSILYLGLSGQAGAGALVNILTGIVNPSGRLAETWPMQYEDCPSATHYGEGWKDAEYHEGIYIGYRYYEKVDKKVRFPFGTGLSYTTFSYEELRATEKKISLTVTNTGKCFGGEAVLLFIKSPQNGLHRAIRELKGFEKLYLAPGESREVSFELDERAFAVWNDGWKVYSGEYIVQIGTLESKIQMEGETIEESSEWTFETGYEPRKTPVRPYTINSTVEDIAKDSFIIRFLYKRFEKMQIKENGRDTVGYKMVMKGASESPLRNVQNSLMLKGYFAQAIADFGNKKYLRGIKKLLIR